MSTGRKAWTTFLICLVAMLSLIAVDVLASATADLDLAIAFIQKLVEANDQLNTTNEALLKTIEGMQQHILQLTKKTNCA